MEPYYSQRGYRYVCVCVCVCEDEDTAADSGRPTRHLGPDSAVSRLRSSARRSHYFSMLAADIHRPPTTTLTASTTDDAPAHSSAGRDDVTSRDVIVQRHGVRLSRDSGHLTDNESDICTERQHVAAQSASQQSV